MGQMMIMVSQMEGLDGVESAHPSSHGIVVEATDTDALEDWLDEDYFTLHDDVDEVEASLRKSNEYIPFSTPHDLYRVLRAGDDDE